MTASEKVRQVAESYSNLNDEERYQFAVLVAPVDTEETDEEWVAELRSRADDVDSGRVKMIDGDEVMRRLRAI